MSHYTDKTVGVVLAGCGVYDGSEIHEAVLTLLALDRLGAKILCMAPDVAQMHVIDHVKGEPAKGESRNVLQESSRIARGEIKKMSQVTAKDIDALIFPGGFGAAKNLCTFSVDGVNCSVNADVERLVKEMHAAKKPQGFICIAPVLAAKILGKFSTRVTIGKDAGTASAIEKMGGIHVNCNVDEVAIDTANKLVSAPAYMLGPTISFVAKGIDRCVEEVLKLAW
ncbi:MAG: isoprenoid biosynthesis glyoxalase ElbB [Candidatus Zhuqueibacterota bacterium]